MNRTELRIRKKPEPMRSGFLIPALLLCVAAQGQGPSTLLRELLWEQNAAPRAPSGTADSSSAAWTASFSGCYNDLYHGRVTDTGPIKTVREQTDVSLPRATGGVSYRKNGWGVAARGTAGRLAAEWSGRDDGYAVRGGASFNSVSLTGWYEDRFASFCLELGYDNGLPLESHQRAQRYNDPHLIQGASIDLKLENTTLTLFESGRALLHASARIEKSSNKSFVEMPLAATLREVGETVEWRHRRDTTRLTLAALLLSSDTSLTGKNVLPSEAVGSGYRCDHALFLGNLPWAPQAEIGLVSLSALVRGFDEGHEASGRAEYCDLDTCDLLFFHGAAGAVAAGVRCGTIAEFVRLGTRTHGKFDPSVSTPFSFFNQKNTKYRIDSLRQGYLSAGLFAERHIPALRRHDSAGVRLDASYVRMEGSIDTREYDFTFLIPRLINPRTWTMTDEKLLLLVPALRYTFRWQGLSCSATLRQLVPVDISGKGDGAPDAAPAVKRTAWGGTLARIDAEYRW